MARLIRRRSMERLELYDLDQFNNSQSTNYELSSSPPPPPLPPPRYFRRPSINPTLERYQFLCNMTRTKTDPIYAATPMFTTIPQTSHEKPHRQLLGSYIRLENVKPLAVKTPEPIKVQVVKDTDQEEEEEEEEIENNDDGENEDNVDDDDQFSNSSSSSTDEQNKADGDDDNGGDDDDDDKKSIVEQIFNRDKKD